MQHHQAAAPAGESQTCHHAWAPYDLVPGTVETAEPAVPNGPLPSDLAYEPSGYTEIDWDSQRTIGRVCTRCWQVVLDEEIVIADITYRRPDGRPGPSEVSTSKGFAIRFSEDAYEPLLLALLALSDEGRGSEGGLLAVIDDERFRLVGVDRDDEGFLQGLTVLPMADDDTPQGATRTLPLEALAEVSIP